MVLMVMLAVMMGILVMAVMANGDDGDFGCKM